MDIHSEIAKLRADGNTFVTATIVKTIGSSPRKVGARMILLPDGSIIGTIGGGNFEQMVIGDGLKLIDENESYTLKSYKFAMAGEDSTGMCCGGSAEVFLEVHVQPKNLILFGGGHVGTELVKLSLPLEFKITVVDDRQDILDGFESPVETIMTDSDYIDNYPMIDANSYVVIVTRSHPCDRTILSKIVNSNAAYIGMIGSRAKVVKMFASLREIGIDQEKLDAVHAPIGLNIGGESPYEIALSIITEIISVRNKIDVHS